KILRRLRIVSGIALADVPQLCQQAVVEPYLGGVADPRHVKSVELVGAGGGGRKVRLEGCLRGTRALLAVQVVGKYHLRHCGRTVDGDRGARLRQLGRCGASGNREEGTGGGRHPICVASYTASLLDRTASFP